MAAEQQAIKPVKNYREAFTSRNVVCFCLVHVFWSIGVYGFMMWMPSIIKAGANRDIVSVGWLAAVPYLVAIVLMLTVSTLSDKIQNRKRFVWPLLLIAGLAFTGSWLVGNDAFWLSYSLLIIATACMYAPMDPSLY